MLFRSLSHAGTHPGLRTTSTIGALEAAARDGLIDAEDARRLTAAWQLPFINAHDSTSTVRDDSQWETLKRRLHDRLNVSKNIILFLSSETKNSKALREEIEYGINKKELPIIVIYPDYKTKSELLNEIGRAHV